jgi:hypothetical protein
MLGAQSLRNTITVGDIHQYFRGKERNPFGAT